MYHVISALPKLKVKLEGGVRKNMIHNSKKPVIAKRVFNEPDFIWANTLLRNKNLHDTQQINEIIPNQQYGKRVKDKQLSFQKAENRQFRSRQLMFSI